MRARRSMTTVHKLLVHAYPGGWSPYSRTRIRVSIGTTHVWVSGWIWVKLMQCVCAAVQFIWDCLFESLERSKKEEKSAGCILAHCMGLGKTLSVSLFFTGLDLCNKLRDIANLVKAASSYIVSTCLSTVSFFVLVKGITSKIIW